MSVCLNICELPHLPFSNSTFAKKKKQKTQQTLIFRISAQHFWPAPIHTQKDLEHGKNQCISWPRCICLAPGLGIPVSCPIHLRCVSQVLPWPGLPVLFTYGPSILPRTSHTPSGSFQLQVPLPTASTPDIPASQPLRNLIATMPCQDIFWRKEERTCVSSWKDDFL